MKKRFLVALMIFVFTGDFIAQSTKYRVFFTDKNNTPYSVSNPSAFLSPRAIQRRANQGIPVTQDDLPADPAYVQQLIAAGASVLHTSRWFNSATVTVPDSSVLAAIQGFPFVQNVSAVNRIKKNLPIDYRENNLQFPVTNKKAALDAQPPAYNYGQSLMQVQQLGGDCMHNQGYDGKNMVICVLDAGFLNVDTLSCFDSLWAGNQVLGTWDFVANDTSVFEDHSHGAMVLSCMASNLPGQLVGTAPKAKYWLLRTEDVGSELLIEEDNWAAGAEFADSVGADIINSSLGYTTFDIPSQNHSFATLDGNTAIATIAADIAASKGIFVCNSAGNEGASSWKYISVPADGDSVCTVGAVDGTGVRAGFSSQGPTADGRIKPDVAAMGNGTSVISPFSGSVVQSGGTSFSSPLIAGMVACLWQANPTKTNMQLLDAIRSSGNQAVSPDTLLGWGIPNFCTASTIAAGSSAVPSTDEDQLVNAFFDPSSQSFSLYFFSKEEKNITISVFDLAGKEHLGEERSLSANSYNYFRLQNGHSLSPGIYFVHVRTADKKFVKKIFKY